MSEVLACLLSLPIDTVVPLLLLPDTVSELILFVVIELLALFLPETVVEQSFAFAVSELRACLLLLPNDSVFALTDALALVLFYYQTACAELHTY